MPSCMCLSQKLSNFQGQITLVENILADCENPGAKLHILNNTPVKFEGFCLCTFGEMLAKNLDGRTDLSQKLSHFQGQITLVKTFW